MPDMETAPLKVNCRQCRSKLDISDLEPYSTFACPVCGAIIRVPERFGRYLLEKVCGVGGMAKIYRALDTKLARRVAVKIIEREHAEGRDFFKTASLISRINHPGVIPVLDCGIENGQPFMVMKYMEQGDLERMLKNHTLPAMPQLFRYLHTIVSALAEAAKISIAHHDVKPSNILISAANEAKLSDFDLADVREFGDLQTPCLEWGSPGYMSPERLYSGGEDFRGDIFSLGVSIYELLSGTLPFRSKGEPEMLYAERKQMDFEPLNRKNPGVSMEFSNLVSSMLSFNPEDRPEYSQIIHALSAVPTARTGAAWFNRKSEK